MNTFLDPKRYANQTLGNDVRNKQFLKESFKRWNNLASGRGQDEKILHFLNYWSVLEKKLPLSLLKRREGIEGKFVNCKLYVTWI